MCNQQAIEKDSGEVATSNEDREFGETLVRTGFDSLMAGDGSPAMPSLTRIVFQKRAKFTIVSTKGRGSMVL